MSFTNYLLTCIISYLGLLGGLALANIAPEELKGGRKYFQAVLDFSFIIVMLLLLYLQDPAIGVLAVIAIGIYIRFGKGKTAMKVEYGVMGGVFALLSIDTIIMSVAASMIFIFGLAGGTICTIRHEKKPLHWQALYILLSNSLFFVTALPLFFLDLKIVA